MSDAGTITPETQIKELTEKLEEETDRLLKLYAAYEQQEAELRDTKAEVEVLEKEIVEREIEKESLEALLTEKDARKLIKNKCIAVAEGANMPCTTNAVQHFLDNKILFAPGKASNAGGVAVSGLEMSQNSLRMNWTQDEVDSKLQSIMQKIHRDCVNEIEKKETSNYVDAANLAGFRKVANAMMDQGLV